MITVLLVLAVMIVVGLAAYAGHLLWRLRAQRQRQQQVRQQRITRLLESIHTIAFAVAQQQCDLSEASLRICPLLDALPINDRPDYALQFPALYELYNKVKHMPTHQARMAQDKATRRAQDEERAGFEERLESAILKEVHILRGFQPG